MSLAAQFGDKEVAHILSYSVISFWSLFLGVLFRINTNKDG